MLNINKLKGKMVENGVNIDHIAEQMGMASSTLYRKLQNGGNQLKIGELSQIVTILNLTADDVNEIFFAPDVADVRQDEEA